MAQGKYKVGVGVPNAPVSMRCPSEVGRSAYRQRALVVGSRLTRGILDREIADVSRSPGAEAVAGGRTGVRHE